MRKILVTGGTVFISRFIAEYFVKLGDEVYVLNRNTRKQPKGTILIERDRHHLGESLKEYDFDVVLDVTAYTKKDVEDLVEALGSIHQYVFISSSAVYAEDLPRPFQEEQICRGNSLWGDYGINKIQAEEYLQEKVPQAYILRPPYIYGPMQNLYREPFVFDCANEGRPFYIPKDGKLPLQFFYIEDLCRFIQSLLETNPQNRIFNVGNPEQITVKEWITLCYEVAGAELEEVYLDSSHPQRSYFPFYDYAFQMDVSKQYALMPEVTSFKTGLRASYDWYCEHKEDVIRIPFFEYLDNLSE